VVGRSLKIVKIVNGLQNCVLFYPFKYGEGVTSAFYDWASLNKKEDSSAHLQYIGFVSEHMN
jgi:hypothetical protein